MSKYNGFFAMLFLFSTVMVASVESQDRDQRFTHSFSAIVESEEILYSYVTPDNGSNPMWCFGNSCIVRYGDRVFSSGLETIPGAEPRNNTRWTLFYNDGNNWELLLRDTIHRTREPSPLGLFSNGSLLLSVNPTLTDPDVFTGPSEPRVLQFSAREPSAGFEVLHPAWDGETIVYRAFLQKFCSGWGST